MPLTTKARKPAPSKRKVTQASVTTGAALAARKKKAGLGKMKDPLFKKYEQINQILKKQNRQGAATRYEIGAHVAQVMAKSGTYGQRAVEQLAKATRMDDSTLRNYAEVAKTWSKKQFEALMKRTGKRGLPVSFSHLREIAEVSDPAERKEWVDRVLKDGWSVRMLKREIDHEEIEALADADDEYDEYDDEDEGREEGGRRARREDEPDAALPKKARESALDLVTLAALAAWTHKVVARIGIDGMEPLLEVAMARGRLSENNKTIVLTLAKLLEQNESGKSLTAKQVVALLAQLDSLWGTSDSKETRLLPLLIPDEMGGFP